MGYDCYATLKPILEYKKFFFKLWALWKTKRKESFSFRKTYSNRERNPSQKKEFDISASILDLN